LRRVLSILARDGELLRGYDAGGAVWYGLPDLPQQVNALLGPRPITVVDLALALSARVWTREETDGLEAVLKTAGFVVEGGVVRKEPANAPS
jgi:hypothetical protein